MIDSWKNSNVLITGCTGFLGSHLTQLLVSRKARVTGLVRDSVPQSSLIQTGTSEKINMVSGCIENFLTVERVINEYEIDTVFHLAAQAIVGTANRNPLSTFEANIKGTWCILEACRRTPLVKRAVVASSDKAYGEQEKLPYDETSPLKGTYPYDVSKSCADFITHAYYKTYGLPVCITRCGNFYGPGDLNFTRIVPGTILSVLNNKPPVIRSDGTFIRDYLYVKDAALAYIHLAEKMEDADIHGEAFNFSNQQPVSVLELTEKILKLMNREDLKPVILNQAEHEILKQYLSAAKAEKLLGWKPKYSLDDGLKETIAWYTEILLGQNERHDDRQ